MIHVEPDWPLHTYSRKELSYILGRMPTDAEWEQANCTEMGHPGHLQCGLCPYHEGFRADCGCMWPFGGKGEPAPAIRVRNQRANLIIEVERIDRFPRGLPALEEILNRHHYSVISPALFTRIKMDLTNYFLTLVNEGRLQRVFPDDRLKYFSQKGQMR